MGEDVRGCQHARLCGQRRQGARGSPQTSPRTRSRGGGPALLRQGQTVSRLGTFDGHSQRILIFFATAASESHAHYLRCWSRLLPQLPGSLANSDVLVYIGAELNTSEVDRWNAIVTSFSTNGRAARAEFGDSHPLQPGAMLPMHLALTRGWLRQYDWVLRLNPDVLVHDGSHLESAFRSLKWWAVLAFCNTTAFTNCEVHTDAYAFRPSELDEQSHASWNSTGRYESFACSSVFRRAIAESRVAWLTGNKLKYCRLSGAGGLVHHHRSLDSCPVPIQASAQR